MTARLLKLLLVLQAATVAALCYAALHYWGVRSLPLALGLGVGALLLVRAAITAHNFVASWRFSSATPERFRLGAGARVRLFCEEFTATMLYSSWTMARARQGQRIHRDASGPPVLLLHGYGCNGGYWAHLTPMLDAAHISHAWLDLEPMLADIDDFVPKVAGAVEALCRDSGAPCVIIVAHSMGGLVARAYMRQRGGAVQARVAHLITLGTPHHGTSLARLAPGRNAMQMRRARDAAAAPESDWLQALASSESAATRAAITSICSHHDNIIAPQTSSLLPGAKNIEFGGIGHVALGRNRHVLACVMREIAAVDTTACAPGAV
jgi:pimeloyl-ACP methyl ester carboxylesterase